MQRWTILRSARLLTTAALACAILGGGPAHISGARAAPAATAPRTSVVLTTDCGADIDDQWALAHVALSPELDLRGVVTTHAATVHVSSAASARCAADVL